MKKTIVLLLAIFCAVVAVAQDAPKAEVFGGYQYLNVDTKGLDGRKSFNGWDVDVAGHLTKNFSIVGDISGAYKTENGVKIRFYNYLFGPRVSVSAGKVTPFAEALFGITHASAGQNSVSISSNQFGMALGGGLDVSANKHFSIRLAKFDYMLNRVKADFLDTSASENLNNYRIATGVVVKF